MEFFKKTFPFSYFFLNFEVLAKYQIEMSRKSLSTLFYVNKSTSRIRVDERNSLKGVYVYLILMVHTFWVTLTCLNILGRMTGYSSSSSPGSGSGGEYLIQNKVVDVAWLTLLLGGYALQLEYFRVKDQVPHLLNQIFVLENKVIAKGGNEYSLIVTFAIHL